MESVVLYANKAAFLPETLERIRSISQRNDQQSHMYARPMGSLHEGFIPCHVVTSVSNTQASTKRSRGGVLEPSIHPPKKEDEMLEADGVVSAVAAAAAAKSKKLELLDIMQEDSDIATMIKMFMDPKDVHMLNLSCKRMRKIASGYQRIFEFSSNLWFGYGRDKVADRFFKCVQATKDILMLLFLENKSSTAGDQIAYKLPYDFMQKIAYKDFFLFLQYCLDQPSSTTPGLLPVCDNKLLTRNIKSERRNPLTYGYPHKDLSSILMLIMDYSMDGYVYHHTNKMPPKLVLMRVQENNYSRFNEVRIEVTGRRRLTICNEDSYDHVCPYVLPIPFIHLCMPELVRCAIKHWEPIICDILPEMVVSAFLQCFVAKRQFTFKAEHYLSKNMCKKVLMPMFTEMATIIFENLKQYCSLCLSSAETIPLMKGINTQDDFIQISNFQDKMKCPFFIPAPLQYLSKINHGFSVTIGRQRGGGVRETNTVDIFVKRGGICISTHAKTREAEQIANNEYLQTGRESDFEGTSEDEDEDEDYDWKNKDEWGEPDMFTDGYFTKPKPSWGYPFNRV